MSRTPLPRWAHVDINSYFATLLQQENPTLRGRPVAVLKDVGRTCVIAASKEAKTRGITTGCRLIDARRLAPDLVTVPANFDMCLSATTRLQQVFHECAPQVEIFSLDEAFMRIDDCQLLYPNGRAFGERVQHLIKHALGEWVTCNVGLSYTKLLAKLASEISAKGSITQVTQQTAPVFLARASLNDVCGIGYRLQERLYRLGVAHPYQINFLTDDDLVATCGPFWAGQLRLIAQGEDTHFLTHQSTVGHMQSIGRSLTGFGLCRDHQYSRRVLANLVEEVIYKVRKLNLAGRRVWLSLRGSGGTRWSRLITSSEQIRHVSTMITIIEQLYQDWQREQAFPIIRWSVGISRLEPWISEPLWPRWQQRERVAQAVDQLVGRYGLMVVRNGYLATSQLIRPEVTGFLGDKSFQLGRLSDPGGV